MPTYDYLCSSCGYTSEEFHHPDFKIMSCPKCSGAYERQLGFGAGIIFKGSGFYSTDYRKSDVKGDFVSGDHDCK